MIKRSKVTFRDQPTPTTATLSGVVEVHAETLTVETSQRMEMIDLTGRVMNMVHDLPIREGVVNLFSLHTTCAILINEIQAALQADIKQFLEHLVPRDAEWLHNDPAHSDCDRFNADSHLRAMLVGQNLTLQVSGGELVLGQWQRIIVAELDGPRSRSIRVMVMGIQ
jgi:secondary thiamine-phosphate synthase enzyme